MIRQYAKGESRQLAPDFWLREFDCRCTDPACVTTYLSDELIAGLQELRDAVGLLTITSGFRCDGHNRSIGGRDGSMHLLGLAADVQSPRLTPRDVEKAAKRIAVFSIGGIGSYKSWIHLDARGVAARWMA